MKLYIIETKEKNTWQPMYAMKRDYDNAYNMGMDIMKLSFGTKKEADAQLGTMKNLKPNDKFRVTEWEKIK